MVILKGDQYAIRVVITIGEGAEEHNITPDELQDMELVLGRHSKTYSAGGVTYDASNQEWLYWFNQRESFNFGKQEDMLARVKIDGEVHGIKLGVIDVMETATRRVL